MKIQNRECLNLECHFRFPQPVDEKLVELCPLCKGATQVVAEYDTEPDSVAAEPINQPFFDCHVLLDNLRSILNVGSIFRTADGAGVSHIHLCGTTPTPAHPRLAKTALGTEGTVPWQYHTNGLSMVKQAKAQGRFIIGLESSASSQSIFVANNLPVLSPNTPLLVIVGNEVAGIDPGILEQCDVVSHLPMMGIKASLNVAVAFGIGIYQLRFGRSIE